MNMVEVVRHSVLSVVLNLKSSFVTVVGVAFALAFVFGIMISIDTIYAAAERNAYGTSIGDGDGSVHSLSWAWSGETEHRLFAAAMSLPAIAVGIIVSVAGANLGISMRAEEAKRLRSKGASDKDVFRVLMTEAAVLGIIAAVIGLVLAMFVGNAVLDSVLNFIFDANPSYEIPGGFLTVSGQTTTYAILSGIGLMLLVSLGPSRRLSRLVAVEEAPKQRKHKRSGLGALLDIILIALSLASIVDILSGWRWEWSHGFDWYTSSIDTFLGSLGLMLFPAMPFMLAVGIAGILTKPPVMLHKRFGRFFARSDDRPESPEEDPVDRKRAARACVLVALVLTFGMFATVTTQSMLEHDKAVARHQVGSDVSLSASYYGYPNGSQWEPPLLFDRLFEIKSLPGVTSASILEHFVPTANGILVAAVVIDPEDYLDTVKPDDDYFDGRGSEEMLELANPGSALVSNLWAETNVVSVGSQVSIHVVTGGLSVADVDDWYLNVTVSGFVEDLPGVGADLLVSYETMSVIPTFNLSLASNGMVVMIDVEDGYDQEDVVSAAGLIFQDAGLSNYYTLTLDDEYLQIASNSEFAGMSDLLTGEFVYLLMVILVGVGMVFYVSALQARTNSAKVDSRGTGTLGREQAVKGESVGVIVLGSGIGVVVALLTTYLFNMLWVPVGWEPVPREVVFTVTSIAMIAASVLFLLITPFVSSAIAKHTKIGMPQQPRGWL